MSTYCRTMISGVTVTLLLLQTALAFDGRNRDIDVGDGGGRPRPGGGHRIPVSPVPPTGHRGHSNDINPWVQWGLGIAADAIRNGTHSGRDAGRVPPRRPPAPPQPTYRRTPVPLYHPVPPYRPVIPYQTVSPSIPTTRIPSVVSAPRNILPTPPPASISVPRNSVPRPRPSGMTAPHNPPLVHASLKALSLTQLKRLTETFDEAIEDRMDGLTTGAGELNILAGDVVESLPITDEDRNLIHTAIEAGDPDGIREYFEQNPLPNEHKTAVDTIIAAADMNQSLNELRTGVNADADPDDLRRSLADFADAQDRLHQGLHDLGIGGDQLDQIISDADQNTSDLDGILSIMSGLRDPYAGWPNGIPNGQLPCAFVCCLPAHSFYTSGGGMICGTGGTSAFEIRDACPGDILDVPLIDGTSVPGAAGDMAGTDLLTIANPSDTRGTIHFILGNAPQSLESGQIQEHAVTQPTLIQFDRGTGTEAARYTLESGNTYHFVVNDKGWDLVRKTFTVTIDNSRNANDFLYVIDNEIVTVPAGESRTHKSGKLVEIRFDQGDGKEARKRLDSGTYVVGVDKDTLRWALSTGEASAAANVSGVRPSIPLATREPQRRPDEP